MTPNVSRIQRLAGFLEDECRRRGVDLVPGQAGHVLRHQARVVAAALHISESWALRSYLDEDAVRGLAANLVREVNAARPVRELVLDVLAKVGGWARDDRRARDCAHPQRPAEGPELGPAIVAGLRALASVAAQQMAWDLYTDAVRLGDQPYAYYADERDGVLLRLPRVCDGMDASWRLRFAGILDQVAQQLRAGTEFVPVCHASTVALALAVSAAPELMDDMDDMDDYEAAESVGLGEGWSPRTADLQIGRALRAIAWNSPALIAYDPEMTYSLEPSTNGIHGRDDLRPEAWFTPFTDLVPGPPSPPHWVVDVLAGGLPAREDPPPFGADEAERAALVDLATGIVEREAAWGRHCDNSGGVEEAPVEAVVLLRPQQLDYMTRKRARSEQQALVVEQNGRLVESAAVRYQVEHDLDDDRDMFDPLWSPAEQDAAPLWAITLTLEDFSGTSALLERLPRQGLGSPYDGGNNWQFASSAQLADRIAGAAFSRPVDGVIVHAPESHGDGVHAAQAWGLVVTRSGHTFCTGCASWGVEAAHHSLITALAQALTQP
ncbi:hypothetical protein [Streptomyces sp. A012304]|uniref:hypothetical protein n=1 Tax=Streptomyces sp. A012304 TaxID=375446 RepID=UPI00222FE5F9|nr:hypothetical protein [Streptomyces sp. A012304]